MSRSDAGTEPVALAARRGEVTPFMIAANFWPLVYLVGGILGVAAAPHPAVGALLAVVWVYLVPPLLGRGVLALFGRPMGRSAPDRRAYKVWWFLTQLQMPFNRLPALEEILRLVPGLYGSWLDLWGSKVNLLAYWSPGVLVTDRYLVRVGKGAVLGARCLLAGHVVTRDPDGGYRLEVAEVRVGEGAILGARSMIGPGCEVHPGEMVPAGRSLGPHGGWKDGRRWAGGRHPAVGGEE